MNPSRPKPKNLHWSLVQLESGDQTQKIHPHQWEPPSVETGQESCNGKLKVSQATSCETKGPGTPLGGAHLRAEPFVSCGSEASLQAEPCRPALGGCSSGKHVARAIPCWCFTGFSGGNTHMGKFHPGCSNPSQLPDDDLDC